MLRIDEIGVYYGQVQAVRRVTLHVMPGEIVTVLGGNGAGKSSLLSAIVGLVPTAHGRVSWGEQRLDGPESSTHRTARLGVALVPEGRQLFSTMTVRVNLLIGGYQHHARRLHDLLGPLSQLAQHQGLRQRLERVYDLFPRLHERQEQIAGSLSGGEQQMLAIGRALMASPRALLLDEPSIGLAPRLAGQILQQLVGLRQEGLAILLVEQDAHAALRIADRGYVMETGRIVAEGTAKQLLSSERMRRAYLG